MILYKSIINFATLLAVLLVIDVNVNMILTSIVNDPDYVKYFFEKILPIYRNIYGNRLFSFPIWFVLLFTCLSVCLISVLSFSFCQRKNNHVDKRPSNDKQIFLMLALSFVVTSGVHRFLPFTFWLQPSYQWHVVDIYGAILTWIGLGLSVILYYSKKLRDYHGPILATLSLLCLLPSDQCSNSFNQGWLFRIGASPLMFIPNIFVIQSVIWHQEGYFRKWQFPAIIFIIIGTAFLGLGHFFRFIW